MKFKTFLIEHKKEVAIGSIGLAAGVVIGAGVGIAATLIRDKAIRRTYTETARDIKILQAERLSYAKEKELIESIQSLEKSKVSLIDEINKLKTATKDELAVNPAVRDLAGDVAYEILEGIVEKVFDGEALEYAKMYDSLYSETKKPLLGDETYYRLKDRFVNQEMARIIESGVVHRD